MFIYKFRKKIFLHLSVNFLPFLLKMWFLDQKASIYGGLDSKKQQRTFVRKMGSGVRVLKMDISATTFHDDNMPYFVSFDFF